MSLPAIGTEAAYRNPMHEVRVFASAPANVRVDVRVRLFMFV